jgi:peptidoglycan/xylan/chitin deacetylase (PgdA/CDA1 family)
VAAAGLVLGGCTDPTTPTADPTATPDPLAPGRSADPSAGHPDGSPADAADPAASWLARLPPEVRSGPADRAAVALTFHGQGDPALAERVLGALESAGARGTVLAVGSWLAEQPALARRILAGGHELGNHTQHHLDLAALAEADAYAEIRQCADVLHGLTGSIGTWFRPSQTWHATATIRALAGRAGYPTCLSYDVDPLDYTEPGAEAVAGNTLNSVHNGAIVSLHLGHDGTLAALPAILAGLGRLGLRAVTVTELLRGASPLRSRPGHG